MPRRTRPAPPMLAPAALTLAAFTLAGCATSDPHDRIVHARFLCDDARRLDVRFRLDRRDAVVRADRDKAVTLPATGAANRRSYAGLVEGGAYSLQGLGDHVDWVAPGHPSVRCEETR